MKDNNKRGETALVTILGTGTDFNGILRFKDALRIRGRFSGTIEATGSLYIDRGADVRTDRISVSSLVVAGSVSGAIFALDKVEMLTGSVITGDVTTSRIRIADGVLFEGRCSMTGVDEDVEIFARPTSEIKTQLLALTGQS